MLSQKGQASLGVGDRHPTRSGQFGRIGYVLPQGGIGGDQNVFTIVKKHAKNIKFKCMLDDHNVAKAVSSISQRAERQKEISKLVNSYVEVGILPQLLNTNNQILNGRRGTGKTHILRVLAEKLAQDSHKTVCYIDARVLGSSPQFSDTKSPIPHRCSSLFIDILNELYDILLSHIVYKPAEDSEKALEALDNFSRTSIQEIKEGRKITQRDLTSNETGAGGKVSLSPSSFGADLNSSSKKTENSDTTEEFNIEDYDKIVFPSLHFFLQKVLKEADTELYIVIDEWSAIPLEIQPFLAEFFKKSFLPIPEITLKIGALEYRSNFTIPRDKHNYIGFELGSDVSSNLDIDDYYVYDRNPDEIAKTFIEILHKHLKSELESDYLANNCYVTTDNQLLQALFTGKPAFSELVRASEGVIRDFINVFSLAFFDAQRSGARAIDKKTIIEASQQWFERDKAKNLDDELQNKLRVIVDEVIGRKKARSFLVAREVEKHEVIQKLFDARVIHFVKRGYSDKENPGVRYNIYSLDYGTYVDLINTSKQPEAQFEIFDKDSDDKDFVVPFDDKRSIRRIILNKEQLD